MNFWGANIVIALGTLTDTLDHSGACVAEPDAPVVLQIVPALNSGGAERTTIDVARAVTAAGWTALVATTGGRMEPELASAGAELILMPVASKSPPAILANIGRLERLIRERNISLVHARSRAPAWSALFAARRGGIPFVTTYHGIYEAKGPLKRWYNSVMARGDAVIANSEWTADHVRKNYGSKVKRLVTIPRGIDLAYFDPDGIVPERIASLRARWRAQPGDCVILLPGRLSRWKGQHVLLDALNLMKRNNRVVSNIRAVIAGDVPAQDNYADELRETIVRQGLSDIARLDGHIADMAVAYGAADIVVSTSTDPEAFGRVPPEAAAMRKPVIATDHGGVRETVLKGESGLLVKPGDPAALADALADLLSRPQEELAAMGEKGRAHIVRNFSVERMCADTLAVYRELLVKSPKA